MTLHWWMHWFWVTTLLSLLLCGGGSVGAPQSEELQHITTELETTHAERRGRAMYFTKTPPIPTERSPSSVTPSTLKPVINSTSAPQTTTVIINITMTPNNYTKHLENEEKPVTNVTIKENTTHTEISTQINASIVTPVPTNLTGGDQNVSSTKRRNNLTRLSDPKETDNGVEGVSESKIVTEKPLSLETALLQTRLPPNIESSRRIVETEAPKKEGMDTGAVAGISFAALALVALGGSTGFVLYRRRFLNKPQTLNDKCSNPDSSGYLDDSTENSEEMYSLDNDSFLNSLEAMTIQNYWTDTVKHTKL